MIGLVFTGGEGPSPVQFQDYLSSPFFKKRMAEPPFVVAADSGSVLALDCGFLPDLLVGDMDSISQRTFRFLSEKKVFIRQVPKDKDESDTDLAVRCALERGAEAVLLVGGGGGRMDHWAALFRSLQRPLAPFAWLTANDIIYRISDSASFSMAPGQPVSFFPLTAAPVRLHSEGLRWPLESLQADYSSYSLSNRSNEGLFSIRIERPSDFPPEETPVVAVVAPLSSLLFLSL